MKYTFRLSVLTATIGLALGGSFAPAQTRAAGSTTQQTAMQTYLVFYSEPGAMHYDGGVSGMRATARRTGAKFDARSADVAAYRRYLGSLQAQHAADIANALNRVPAITHTYVMTHSGAAMLLTDAEAAIVRGLPGVAEVEAAPIYQLATYRGPSFIGADTIWSQTPVNPTNRGRGAVIGVLDGGTNSTHPSFANDASCGFSDANPKLLSFRDCSSSADGVCNGSSPEDHGEGHGVHTASTAAGNTITAAVSPSPLIPPPFTEMSGVAPCASLRSYKVCGDDGSCGGDAVLAGIDNIVSDADVDVVNFSISGGLVPWSSTDVDRFFLDLVDDGIFVVAAAGNITPDIPDPSGWANHRGPWIMSVAAATHDATPLAELSITAPGQPGGLQGIALNQGDTTPPGDALTDAPIRDYPANVLGCTASGGFPAGTFANAIAVVERGTCAFGEKIANAANAGALMVIIANNQPGSLSMDTTGAPNVPAYSISSQAVGDELIAYVEANVGTATASFDTDHRQGDRLGEFSLRGPLTNSNFDDLTKPDVAAPGVHIYAAQNAENGEYGYMSGTSMAAPHVAGAAALIRAQHPTWDPMAIKSALQMTAKSDGFREDGISPWTIDDVGSGRIRVDQATRAGLVMEETTEHFIASNPLNTPPAMALTELNVPSLRNTACTATCMFTRTVTSTLATTATWSASFESGDLQGIRVGVEPQTFTIMPGGTQTITVSVDMGSGDAINPPLSGTSPLFGNVVLRESASQSPDEHITFAIAGTRHADRLFASGFDGDGDATNVVHFDDVNYEFPVDYPWGAIDWLTGATCNCNIAPYPFTVWVNAGGVAFQFPAMPGGDGTYGGVIDPGSGTQHYSVLHSGAVIGPDSVYGTLISGLGATNWQNGIDGYLGFRFWNADTHQVNYGYAHLVTTAPGGIPTTLVDYAFDRTGRAITIP